MFGSKAPIRLAGGPLPRSGAISFWTPDLLDRARSVSGGEHCFLKQVASTAGADVRTAIEAAVDGAPAVLHDRWTDLLHSFDNRRFFQGWAEAATAERLRTSGWSVDGIGWPGPTLSAGRGADRIDVLVLAFIRQARPEAERQARVRLARALDRVQGRRRIAVLVRRPLPPDFDPDPIRRSVESWLADVDAGRWQGRWATYDDGPVSLEFALGDRTAAPGRGVVTLVLGPFPALPAVEVLEKRVVLELDQHRLVTRPERPLVVACVANQPWNLPPGWLIDVLYGRPARWEAGPDGMAIACPGGLGHSVFRDPLYRFASGVALGAPTAEGGTRFDWRAWWNPWADRPVPKDALACPTLCPARLEEDCTLLRWVG